MILHYNFPFALPDRILPFSLDPDLSDPALLLPELTVAEGGLPIRLWSRETGGDREARNAAGGEGRDLFDTVANLSRKLFGGVRKELGEP